MRCLLSLLRQCLGQVLNRRQCAAPLLRLGLPQFLDLPRFALLLRPWAPSSSLMTRRVGQGVDLARAPTRMASQGTVRGQETLLSCSRLRPLVSLPFPVMTQRPDPWLSTRAPQAHQME